MVADLTSYLTGCGVGFIAGIAFAIFAVKQWGR